MWAAESPTRLASVLPTHPPHPPLQKRGSPGACLKKCAAVARAWLLAMSRQLVLPPGSLLATHMSSRFIMLSMTTCSVTRDRGEERSGRCQKGDREGWAGVRRGMERGGHQVVPDHLQHTGGHSAWCTASKFTTAIGTARHYARWRWPNPRMSFTPHSRRLRSLLKDPCPKGAPPRRGPIPAGSCPPRPSQQKRGVPPLQGPAGVPPPRGPAPVVPPTPLAPLRGASRPSRASAAATQHPSRLELVPLQVFAPGAKHAQPGRIPVGCEWVGVRGWQRPTFRLLPGSATPPPPPPPPHTHTHTPAGDG